MVRKTLSLCLAATNGRRIFRGSDMSPRSQILRLAKTLSHGNEKHQTFAKALLGRSRGKKDYDAACLLDAVSSRAQREKKKEERRRRQQQQ